MDTQHALKADGRTHIACLGILWLNDFAWHSTQNDGLHRVQKLVTPGGLVVVLEHLVGYRGQGLGVSSVFDVSTSWGMDLNHQILRCMVATQVKHWEKLVKVTNTSSDN